MSTTIIWNQANILWNSNSFKWDDDKMKWGMIVGNSEGVFGLGKLISTLKFNSESNRKHLNIRKGSFSKLFSE